MNKRWRWKSKKKKPSNYNFMDTIITMSWCIWMQWNDIIFLRLQYHPQNCKLHFKREFALVIRRAKAHYKEAMSLWLEALL